MAAQCDAQPSVTMWTAKAAGLECWFHDILFVGARDVERVALPVAEPVDDNLARATFLLHHLLDALSFAHLLP